MVIGVQINGERGIPDRDHRLSPGTGRTVERRDGDYCTMCRTGQCIARS